MILKLSSFGELFWIWAWAQLTLCKTYKMTCFLGRLRSDNAVRVVWSASSLKKPWALGSHTAADRDSGKTAQRCRQIWVFARLTVPDHCLPFYFTYIFVCVDQQPAPRSPHFSHFRKMWDLLDCSPETKTFFFFLKLVLLETWKSDMGLLKLQLKKGTLQKCFKEVNFWH